MVPRGGVLELTQKLLKHLAVVEVLLQLFHNDALLCQHVVDPVQEHLGEVRGCQSFRRKQSHSRLRRAAAPTYKGYQAPAW